MTLELGLALLSACLFVALLCAATFGYCWRSEGLWQRRRAEGWRKRTIEESRKRMTLERPPTRWAHNIVELVDMSDRPVRL